MVNSSGTRRGDLKIPLCLASANGGRFALVRAYEPFRFESLESRVDAGDRHVTSALPLDFVADRDTIGAVSEP